METQLVWRSEVIPTPHTAKEKNVEEEGGGLHEGEQGSLALEKLKIEAMSNDDPAKPEPDEIFILEDQCFPTKKIGCPALCAPCSQS